MKNNLSAKTGRIWKKFSGAAKAFVAIAAFAFSSTAWAEYKYQTVDGVVYTYTIESEKATIVDVPDTTAGDITIPNTLGGKQVTVIGPGAFEQCHDITSVSFQKPVHVTRIEDDAFWGCTSLSTFEIPDGVTFIGHGSFACCDLLESVMIPDSVTEIDRAFYSSSSLENLTIPDSVTKLAKNVCEGCSSLEWVKMPLNLATADARDKYFKDCPADLAIASYVTVGGLTWNFRVVDGGAELYYDEDNGETTIPDTTAGAVVIPSTLGGYPVVSIGDNAFEYCDQLTSVTIPATVTSIGDEAFEGCEKLTPWTVPETVTEIGDMAFLGCDGMADANGFVVVRGVLHNYAGPAKKNEMPVTIPEGVTRIGPEVFYNNKLTAVTFPASLTSIGENAFFGCVYLKDVTIPESVPDAGIGEMAFYGCTGMADADGFVVVRNYLHYYGGDKGNVTVPEGVAVVGKMAFSHVSIDNTTLKSVRLPVSVASISANAFYRCTALTEMEIPRSVGIIMMNAFGNTALDTVHVEPGRTAEVKKLIQRSRYAYYNTINYIEDLTSSHEVTFNANGGSVSPSSRFVLDGKAVGTLPEATLAGYTLDGWFTADGMPVTADTVVTADVTYYASWMKNSTLPWFTTRAEALAEAKKTGKTVFMICGRDTCGNTMMTKNVSCEDPKVRDLLTAKCVLWYSNCDTQMDENYRYWRGLGSGITLPIICAIDPKDPEHSIFCIAGPQIADGILLLLQWIPEPSASSASSAIDPETIDPSNPGDLPWYKVINARDIWDPVRVSKAETLRGALYYGAEVMGIVELKLGKLSRNRTSKVSGTVTTLDGKKHKIKANTLSVDSTYAGSLNLEVSGLGGMYLAVGSIGGVNVFAGSLGKWHVQSANVGGNWTKANATAVVAVGDVSAFGSGVLTDLLPTNEVAAVASGKWTFKKAASVKWAKPKADQATFTPLDAKGKGLIIDMSKDKTNFSGLKLTYTPKKGTFKGSFKVYAVQAGKVKKFTINANGVVVDGVGYGTATCKRPAITWSVTVE